MYGFSAYFCFGFSLAGIFSIDVKAVHILLSFLFKLLICGMRLIAFNGFQGPTWSLLKMAFLTLGVCLASMLALAFSSSDVIMMIHILIFVVISGTLFLLVSR